MKLETKRLILREVKQRDQLSIRKNINNLKIARFMGSVSYPHSKKDADWFVNACIKDQKKKPRKVYNFGITIKPNNFVVGIVSFGDVDEFNKTARLGYWLGEDYWRNGYMFEAAKKLIEFGFNTLKLRRININAQTQNNPSNNLIKKLGFRHEGTRIKDNKVKSTGKIVDTNVYGMLKEEWLKARKKLK